MKQVTNYGQETPPEKPDEELVEFVFEPEIATEFILACREKKQNPHSVLEAYMRYYAQQFDLFD